MRRIVIKPPPAGPTFMIDGIVAGAFGAQCCHAAKIFAACDCNNFQDTPNTGPVASGNTLCRNSIATPKLPPPPPLHTQYGSGSDVALAARIRDGGDGPFVSAERAQRRTELSARIGCGEKIAVLWVRRSQEQHLASQYVRKRRQRRRVGQRERCNGLHGKDDAERVCWRKFLDLKRMFHGSHLLAVSPRAPDRKTLDITIDCCNDF